MHNEDNKKYNEYDGTCITHTYLFNHSIDKVWSLLKDMIVWFKHKDLYSSFKYGEGPKNKIGGKFSYYYKKTLFVTNEITQMTNEKFFKRIFIITDYNNSFKSTQDFKLYKNSSENSAFLSYNITFSKDLGESLANEILYDRIELFTAHDKYLSDKKKSDFEQAESCIINKSKKEIMNVILNFSDEFCKVVKGIADEVTSDTKTLKLHSLVTFKYLSKKVDVNFRVTLLENSDNNPSQLRFSILKESKSKEKLPKNELNLGFYKNVIQEEAEYLTPKQEISFQVTEAIGNCLLVFKHSFKKEIRNSDLIKLSKSKKLMLKDLKKHCEKP